MRKKSFAFSPRRLTLTRRVILLSLAAGVIILMVLDVYVRRQVRSDFSKQLTRQLQIQVNEGRLRFDNYVKGHFRLARIIGGQARFLDYIANHDFTGHAPRRYQRPPAWLPPLSMLRQLTRVDYFILVDDAGQAREYYCVCKKGLPPGLQTIDATTLRASQNENFMTMVDGRPYILSSVTIGNRTGTASLLLASEVNDTLLASMHPAYRTGDQILALVTGYTPAVLASSDILRIPPGATVAKLTKDYLYFGAKVFNYEYADLLVTYAQFLPRNEINTLAAPVIRRQRIQLILVAALFTLLFVSIMLWISYRIAVITREIISFSQDSLGGAVVVDIRGNELEVLRNHFRLLADEVRSMTRQQALLLQTVVDAIPAPLFYKDAQGVYQGCNQAFVDYLGKPRQEIVKHTVFDIAPKELADIYYKADQQLMSDGGRQVYEAKVRFADDTEHDIIFHKAVFADESG
ncbi:MAG TPA: PAS domain-containing protein, partial [Desulfobulbaceae bacterium]|nr:PAS domain-containing protein [Desulfobulbaceae bacterium]